MRKNNSVLYKKMQKNIQSLRTQFCTPEVLRNSISESSQLFIDAYLVLVHAEFESYIETCIKNKIDRDLNNFRTKHKLTMSIASCAAFSNKTHNPPQELSGIANNSFESIVNENVNLLYNSIEKNHGIKQHNIVPLLVRVGFDFDTIVHDDLPSIDNDEIRRYKPSTWKKYGEATALLTGDALLNQSYSFLHYV